MAKRPTNTTIKLGKALVLNRWVLHQFGVDALESLVDGDLKRSIYEGLDAENKSNIHNYLLHRLPSFNTVTKDDLIRWDQHIVRHTLAISEGRDEVLKWKYFQYITLLFTELYLERFFKDRDALLLDLNEYVEQWNAPLNEQVRNTSGHVCEPFTAQEINKIAYWNATGSGKTLLMHVNILQYKHYVERYGLKKGLNKVLLVTPNEGLSQQHLEEFKQNGIQAELFSKSAGSAFSGETVEVIEISKLAEESGEKTVAVEAFETNNLVLIDEGHRGVAGEQWKTRRDELSANGFAFEYSATFGQAVSAANGKKRAELTQEYAKSILMDYSYKYFHEDGYGKDYRILNLPSDERAEQKRKYMTGSLLAFYQQKLAFRDHPQWAAVFQVSDPLWVFVGGSVNAVRKVGGVTTSDVLEVVRFCKQFIAEPKTSKEHLQELLSGNDGLLDQVGKSVFTGFFNYLNKHQTTTDQLYADILESVFNNTLVGADVYVDRLKGQDGELGLRVGNAEYFGVVNVGDEKKLWDLCQANGIDGQDKDFTGSLFHDINLKGSRINLLIGSKKFTEGWSSWRVSTMGLLNIGKSEGSQVIQLFGRGVRLKGYELSLKRSQRLDQDQRPESKLPKDIPILETLNVFGIQADYMQHFKQFLQEEGLAPKDGRFISVEVPTMINIDLKSSKLKVLQLRENVDFRKDQMIPLVYDAGIGKGSVRLEWYAKLQQLVSAGGVADVEVHYNTPLNEQHLAFVDWDEVYFALQRHKNERIWNNLGISIAGLQQIMQHHEWYQLQIPPSELKFDSYDRVKEWQEICIALLKSYAERYYNWKKAGYLSEFMETIELRSDHPNFQEVYQLEIEESRKDIIDRLNKAKEFFAQHPESEEKRELDKGMTVFQFLRHLYQPLIYLDAKGYQDIIKISPVALNQGEYDLIKHLKHFYEQDQAFFTDRKLYLLRNKSRKGIGFFEAHGFYPDFIVWLVEKEHQYITFIDPKGLRQIQGLDHPKLKFHHVIKEKIEAQIKKTDPNVTLNSFIVSPTSYREVRHWRGQESIADMNKHHVYFMDEQRETYVGALLRKVVE